MMSTDEFESLISDLARISLPESHDDAAQHTKAWDILKQQTRQRQANWYYNHGWIKYCNSM